MNPALAAAQAECPPGWHLWESHDDNGQPTGCFYATHAYTTAEQAAITACGGVAPAGVTLDVPSPGQAPITIRMWMNHVLTTGRAA